MKKEKKILVPFLAAALAAGCITGCGGTDTQGSEPTSVDKIAGDSASENSAGSVNENTVSESKVREGAVEIVLSDDKVTVDGNEITSEGAVTLSNDIVYYEDKDTYDSGNTYGEGTEEERHSVEDAAAHKVVNITEAGTYLISGSLSQGQIRVDLGEDAAADPEAVVTLILENAEITCEVAPAIVFRNVYECDNEWSAETASSEVNTEAAGANLIIADGSTNQVTGSHVARIFEDSEEEKKLWKQDGAVYSYMSMNVSGEQDGSGVLNITADNEGLDTELHLTINSGNINIRSQNDGINTNEDGVSVTTINGGNIHIIAGLGEEGDGVDSNGWLVINGGTVIASANPAADAGLDSDMGSYINGGTVVALGSTMDWAESDSQQVTMNLQFAEYKDSDSAIVITDEEGNYVFAYDPSMDEVVGENIRKYMGAIISCPDFAVEDNYYVYVGGTITGTESAGIYVIAGITAYEGGVQQSYTGTDVGMGFGGMGPGGMGGGHGMGDQGFGGERPDGEGKDFAGGQKPDGDVQNPGRGAGEKPENGSERPEMPTGEVPTGEVPTGAMPSGEVLTQMPEGVIPGEGKMERPDGEKTAEMPSGEVPTGEMPGMPSGDMPAGMPSGEVPAEMPSGQVPTGQMPEGFTPGEGNFGTMTGEASTVFYMQDKVNCFSGVADAAVNES